MNQLLKNGYIICIYIYICEFLMWVSHISKMWFVTGKFLPIKSMPVDAVSNM